jgi:hypothetical protein
MELTIEELQKLLQQNQISQETENSNIGKYVICRTYSAGVHAGILVKRNGKEGILRDARRIWYWEGAASLSEMAVRGVSKPEKCKFPCEVMEIELTGIIEIIPCTSTAQKSIKDVPVWTAQK